MTTGYCVKCRVKREMSKASRVSIRGRSVIRGLCPKCGTRMFRFV